MKKKKFPVFSLLVLGVIILGCLFGKVLATGDPFYMNLTEVSLPPGSAHYFGTDTMGRDIYSMIWEGGRVSLYIGILATAISSVTAIVYGCVSGLVPDWLDDLLMRFTEIILSIPSILLVIFLQALLGEATATSIAVVIGLTSWMNISKVVRSEVRQIRNSDFVLASRLAGGKFFYILRKHLFPNILHHVHDRHKCKRGDRHGGHLKFSGNWPSHGDHFLGQHDVPFTESPVVQLLVDHSDPRAVPGNHSGVYHQCGRVHPPEKQQRTQQPIKRQPIIAAAGHSGKPAINAKGEQT